MTTTTAFNQLIFERSSMQINNGIVIFFMNTERKSLNNDRLKVLICQTPDKRPGNTCLH